MGLREPNEEVASVLVRDRVALGVERDVFQKYLEVKCRALGAAAGAISYPGPTLDPSSLSQQPSPAPLCQNSIHLQLEQAVPEAPKGQKFLGIHFPAGGGGAPFNQSHRAWGHEISNSLAHGTIHPGHGQPTFV